MTDTSHDHELVSIYGMSEAQTDRLMTQASECVLMWSTRDGWPVGVTVAVSGVAARDVPGAATMKGRATFHDDDATKAWFYPSLAAKVRPDSQEGKKAFEDLLDSPLRVILEIKKRGLPPR